MGLLDSRAALRRYKSGGNHVHQANTVLAIRRINFGLFFFKNLIINVFMGKNKINLPQKKMKDSNIFQLLGTLSRAEHKQLAQWLQSPLFNRQPQPLALYRYLHQCLEQKRPPLPEAAWSHMTTEPAQHPTKNIPERRGRPRTQARTSRPSDQTEAIQLRLAMSTLLALTEDFLVYQYRANDRVRHAVDLMACYREKGLDQAFEKTLHAARKASQKQPHRHTGYFDAEADIAFEWYQYAGNHRKTEELHLQTLSLLTDTAYAARKLREACLAITYQTVYRNTVDQGMLNALLDYVKQSPQFLATPAVALYYYCYLLFAGEQDRAWFSQFKQLLMAQ